MANPLKQKARKSPYARHNKAPYLYPAALAELARKSRAGIDVSAGDAARRATLGIVARDGRDWPRWTYAEERDA